LRGGWDDSVGVRRNERRKEKMRVKIKEGRSC
jgi:hypothetical protein